METFIYFLYILYTHLYTFYTFFGIDKKVNSFLPTRNYLRGIHSKERINKNKV